MPLYASRLSPEALNAQVPQKVITLFPLFVVNTVPDLALFVNVSNVPLSRGGVPKSRLHQVDNQSQLTL